MSNSQRRHQEPPVPQSATLQEVRRQERHGDRGVLGIREIRTHDAARQRHDGVPRGKGEASSRITGETYQIIEIVMVI